MLQVLWVEGCKDNLTTNVKRYEDKVSVCYAINAISENQESPFSLDENTLFFEFQDLTCTVKYTKSDSTLKIIDISVKKGG